MPRQNREGDFSMTEHQLNEMSEVQDLIENVTEATNAPRFGIFEQVLSGNIYQAANTPDPLRKIQLVTDSVFMLDPKKREALKIDMDMAQIVKTVATAFQNRTITKVGWENRVMVSVVFGFPQTEEYFDSYIAPWVNDANTQFFVSELGRNIDAPHYCRNINWFYEQPQYVRAFKIFAALTEQGYNAALCDFIGWSHAYIMETIRKLTEAVRPEIYNEIAKLFTATNREGSRIA